jgi:hypothetical protein
MKGKSVITVDDLTNAIGKPMQDPAVQALLGKLGPGTRKKDDLGIYYRHKTTGTILVENEGRLATIFLNPKGRGLSQYPGEIPFGARFGQAKSEVREMLGEPTKAVGSIADEYDQGLWTFRVDYDDAAKVEGVSVKAV